MSILHAVVLGIVQGLTEFLPVSSSGHLRLVPWLFDWNDFVGHENLEKTFDVALHLGTFVGAVAYFRADIIRLLRGVRYGRRAPVGGTPDADTVTGSLGGDHRLAWLLVVASIPAATVGMVLDKVMEGRGDFIWLIAVLLIVFGGLLWWADTRSSERTAGDFGLRDAVLMGTGQALALQPGVSRSGVTMTVGRWLGLERDAVARISFLMSLPIIGGAMAYKGAQVAGDGFPSAFALPFAAGIAASAVTGYLAVWGTIELIKTRSFAPFVVYRVVVGLAVLGWYFAR